MRIHKITVLPGDGIGPEIVEETLKVLSAAGKRYDFQIQTAYAHVGGAALDAEGVPLSDATIALCQQSDAVLLGAVGGPKWDHLSGAQRPEQGLLQLRKSLGLFCNLRPVKLYEPLKNKSPLKDRLTSKGVDMLFVRELTGGIYFGEKGLKETEQGVTAWDVETYSSLEIARIAEVALLLASQRSGRLTSVDKANVLESSRLWRKTVNTLAESAKPVEVNHMYVDNCAMQLIIDPAQFDVVLTSNLFGDILSDEASSLGGSIGLMPSASLGEMKSASVTLQSAATPTYFGLYEPIHGSAPDIAGKGIANPIGAILSGAMMLRYSLGEHEAANAIEAAVEVVLTDGRLTPDLATSAELICSTHDLGCLITDCIVKA